MGALSWVRLSRQVSGLVRQKELVNLEALLDAEAGRQPGSTLFTLSCAIPAGIGTFGGLSVFVAWLAGNTGLPLILGTAFTAVLAAGAWFTFFRLYHSIPPTRRRIRDMIFKLSQRYVSFGNIFLGERALSEEFAELLDDVAGIYLRHGAEDPNRDTPAMSKAVGAIEEAMARLLEIAVSKDRNAQSAALSWAQPMVEELRHLDESILAHNRAAERERLADPLTRLREARSELETNRSAIEELDEHLKA